MRKWIIGGCAVAIAVVAAIVSTPTKSNTPTPPAPAANPAAAAATPSSEEPAVLAQVIDVTDIDPLLDPPAIPQADPGPTVPMLTAVGYEVPAPRTTEPAAPVVPIPPAAEDESGESQ